MLQTKEIAYNGFEFCVQFNSIQFNSHLFPYWWKGEKNKQIKYILVKVISNVKNIMQ